MGTKTRLLLLGLMVAISGLAIFFPPPTWVFPVVFLFIFLFYTNTLIERVPLYLSNQSTQSALSQLIEQEPESGHFVDLGCGFAGTLITLSRAHPKWTFVGVETAPGPYLVSKIRVLGLPNVTIKYQSLWNQDLSTVNMAYAFLSPAPMAKLIAKAKTELRTGALLVSNSFWADNTAYDGEVTLNDQRQTRLIMLRQT